MDYSKLSDFEIDSMVSAYLWGSVCAVDGVVLHNEKDGPFDPCNNPEDAWLIILENKISIVSLEGEWGARSYDCIDRVIDVKPLRAAMIVFLMMHDDK